MNCTQIQKNIFDSLAAAREALPVDIAGHLTECPACRLYHERQLRLFRSLQTGLETLANANVPSSLAPRIRARLEEQPLARRFGSYGWGLAAVAVVAILASGLALTRYQPQVTGTPLELTRSVTTPEQPKPTAVSDPPQMSRELVRRSAKRSAVQPSSGVAHDLAAQVVVLAEEREAFQRFVAQLSAQQDLAVALAHPAPAVPEHPVEIALLQIDFLDVTLPDSTARE